MHACPAASRPLPPCRNSERRHDVAEERKRRRHRGIQPPHARWHPLGLRFLAPARRARDRPGADKRSLRQRPPADRGVFRPGAPCQSLGRTGPRQRRVALRPRSFRNVPQRDDEDGTAGQDAAELRVGDRRACRLGLPCAAQQRHRSLRRGAASGRVQLAAPAWRQRVLRHQHQRGHVGQPDFVPLQPYGVLDCVLHGLLRRA